MTATLGFGWTYNTSTTYVITEFFADGTSRTVSPQYALYVTWIQTNTPVYLSTLDNDGNPEVTFVGGVQNTTMYPGYTVWIGGLPSTNSQVAIDQAAAALAVAQAFTNSRQWIYFNQIVTLVAADTAAGSPWAVISQATFNLWRTWEMSVLTAFEAYVATPSTANMTALNTALAANPPMNL
jgi:hypothetical protein